MRQSTCIAVITSTLLALSGARPLPAAVLAEQVGVISASGECVDKNGLEMDGSSDDRIRFACLQNAQVQKQCDLDGRLARLAAFRQWMAKLKEFERQCDQKEGLFSFQSTDFREPTSENFCAPAQVQVTYGQFENPICRFVSQCPSVPVLCQTGSAEPTRWKVPTQAVQLPGVPIPVPIQ